MKAEADLDTADVGPMLARPSAVGATGLWYWPWHAVLVAIFPVVFLFAENVADQITLEPLWMPLGLAIGGAVVVLLVCQAFRRDWPRAGLMATVLLGLFFTYGHIWNLVDELVAARWILTGIWIVWSIGLVQLAWRGGGWVLPATQALNVTLALLVVFNVVRIGSYLVSARLFAASTGDIPAVVVGDAGRPDVYYIILDRYAGEGTLDQVYDFDNTPFLEALAQRGFAVAHDSWANYFKTALSVVSSMSMDYLDAEAYNQATPDNFEAIHVALQTRLAVPATFKALGYEYVHIGNWWEPSSTNVDADVVEVYSTFSEFSTVLAATTMLLALSPAASPDEDPESLDYPELARRHVLFGFDAIEAAATRPGPTFTFAHLTIPHTPYVFNPDGSMPTPAQKAERPENEEYLAQLQYANTRILEVLDTILASVRPGEPDPVIILQADEGPWPPGFTDDQDNFDWLEASDEEIGWKFRILNAYHMPEANLDAEGFSDGITPVNAFRILFNAYFGADLELLPDIVYLSPDYDHMFDFVPYQH